MKRLNWIAAVLIVLLLLVGYVGAYFASSDFVRIGPTIQIRCFPSDQSRLFFSPMLWIEREFRGHIEAVVANDGRINL